LDELIESYRGKYDYDCLIPFSGGKDSTFTLYYLVNNYNVKPLVVTFDHLFLRPRTLQNNIRTLRKLGVDYLKFAPNWKVVKKTMIASLKATGDFCWHCHCGVFANVMQIAVRFQVPLILWGEQSSEYTSYYSYDEAEEVNEERFNRMMMNLGISIEKMLELTEGLTERDLRLFKFPSVDQLKKLNYRSVCLGSYIKWDTQKHSEIIKKEIGWEPDDVEGVPPKYDYEKVECMLTGVRDWCKYIKRGYARATHLACIDIRQKRITREYGEKLVGKYEGFRPASLDYFLEITGFTELEFNSILSKQMVPPYVHNFEEEIIRGKKLWDQDLWDTSKSLNLKK
jgi:N-acetyl sugar amidotransferase